jgi:hypothetical protein
MLKLALVILLFSTAVLAADRKVETQWNPNCTVDACKQPNAQGSWINLQYVKLTGTNDVVHYLYSNIQSFTIMVFKTNLTAELSIDWPNLLSNNASLINNSIKFTDTVYETAGYEIASIYEFNDVDGTADMTQVPANQTFEHRTDSFVWRQFNATSNVSGVFEASYPSANGSFRIQVRYPGSDQRDVDLPHLLLKPEGTSVEFVIDDVQPVFNMSKFGVNVIYLTKYDLITKTSLSTIDDEYTPGTFKLWNADVTDESGSVRNHLQWKPIFYFATPKTLENSTITHQYDLSDNKVVSTGIGRSVFGPDRKFKAMNVSFGLEGNEKDGYFYKQTRFSSWTFSVGLGPAPVETMSFVVTLVIIVGFGLPALVILVGLVVMIARKIRNSRHSDFQPL